MMLTFDHTVEKIEITRFLAIRRASIELGDITAIIGPQASGKSILAKIVFFGREYFASFAHGLLETDFDLRAFKKSQADNFLALFGGLVGYDDEFSVTYTLGEFSITISRSKKGAKPRVSASKSVERIGSALRRDYQKFLSALDEKNDYRVSSFYYFRSSEERTKAQNMIPNTLFVPAARSFYSTVSQEVFTFLAADERVGQLTAQFGRFFEFAKRRASGEMTPDVKRAQTEARRINRVARPVIGGEFQRQKSKDFIKTDWGRVPLPNASSGQQEALPLLLSLTHFPSSRRELDMLIIEEPEAHLFPVSQKYVLDQMVGVTENRKCRILFTTHSPYILACLNVHLARWQRSDGSNPTVKSYMVVGGACHSIMDEPEGLIDTNALDEVSEAIASEFIEALGD